MASSSQRAEKRLFDPVRKTFVKATKEEVIRQRWIKHLVENLGFPLSLLAVEKELSSLPHTPHIKLKRRIDIVAFANNIHPDFALFPLLLIECKAHHFTTDYINQALSYNSLIHAPYVALANESQMVVGATIGGKFSFSEGLASYSQLISALQGSL